MVDKAKLIIHWVVSIFVILGSLTSFGNSVIGSVLTLIVGVAMSPIIFPKVTSFIVEKKYNFNQPSWIVASAALFIIFIIGSSISVPNSNTSPSSNTDTISKKADSLPEIVSILCTNKNGTILTKFNTKSLSSVATVDMPSLGLDNKTNPAVAFTLNNNVAALDYPKLAKMWGLKTYVEEWDLLTGKKTNVKNGKAEAGKDECKLVDSSSSTKKITTKTPKYGGEELYEFITSNKWGSTGIPCDINGGSWTEYGPQFQIGEKFTAGGKRLKDSPQRSWFKIFKNTDNVTIKSKIYAEGNNMLAPAVGGNTVVSDVVRVITQEGNKIRVKSTIKMLDLMPALNGKIKYKTTKENSNKHICP